MEKVNFLDDTQVSQQEADQGYNRSKDAKVISSNTQVDHDLISDDVVHNEVEGKSEAALNELA